MQGSAPLRSADVWSGSLAHVYIRVICQSSSEKAAPREPLVRYEFAAREMRDLHTVSHANAWMLSRLLWRFSCMASPSCAGCTSSFTRSRMCSPRAPIPSNALLGSELLARPERDRVPHPGSSFAQASDRQRWEHLGAQFVQCVLPSPEPCRSASVETI